MATLPPFSMPSLSLSLQVCALVVFVMACVPCVCCWHINRKRPRDGDGNPVVRTHYSAAVMNRDFTVVSQITMPTHSNDGGRVASFIYYVQ